MLILITMIIINIIIVDSAFTSGVTPVLTMDRIFSGSVVLPGPVTKKLMITSSMERENDNSAPDVTPGIIKGRIIFLKVTTWLAPKSIAASSRYLSNPANLARTEITTNGMQKVIWEIVILIIPSGISITE